MKRSAGRIVDRTEVAISLRFIAVGTASLHFVSSASWAGACDGNEVAIILGGMIEHGEVSHGDAGLQRKRAA